MQGFQGHRSWHTEERWQAGRNALVEIDIVYRQYKQGALRSVFYSSLSSTVEYLSILFGRGIIWLFCYFEKTLPLWLQHLQLWVSCRPHSGSFTVATTLPACGYSLSSCFIWFDHGIQQTWELSCLHIIFWRMDILTFSFGWTCLLPDLNVTLLSVIIVMVE